jgi:hypothetical protein
MKKARRGALLSTPWIPASAGMTNVSPPSYPFTRAVFTTDSASGSSLL